jgi:hypothetical protein
MDLKTDTVIGQLWISKLETLKTEMQRSKAVEILQAHGIDGRPMARLAPVDERESYNPFVAAVSMIETRLPAESSPLRPFPLYRSGSDVFYSAVLLESAPKSPTKTISVMRSGSDGGSKAIGESNGFGPFNGVLGAVISPWEPRIVVVVLQLSTAFKCGGEYGGLILAGAHLETGNWTTKPAVRGSADQRPVAG